MDLSAIKAQLEEAANEDYKKTLSEATVERPDDADLFKDNQSTAAVVEQVIQYDAEAEKAKTAYASGVFHADSSSGNQKRRRSSVIEAEVVEPKPASSGWGYYGSRTTTTTQIESELAKEQRKAAEQVDRLFKDAIDDTLFEIEEEFDVFSMYSQAEASKTVTESFRGDRDAYKKHQQKLKRQATFYRSLLKICKTALKVSKKATIYKEGV